LTAVAPPHFKATDWEDAYNRLNRFRERYLREKSYLDPAEAQALRKVFEEDTFIKEMLDIRQIGKHAHKRGVSAIRLMTNAPIPICVKTSALGFFNAPSSSCPTLPGSPLHQSSTEPHKSREQNPARTHSRHRQTALKAGP